MRSWILLLISGLVSALSVRAASADYTVYVTNERSGTVSVIDGTTRQVEATWPVGKRPRGVHLSPDGRFLYVAVSGSPIIAPGVHADRAKAAASDKSADGIVVVDTATGRVLRRLAVGSDPEQFALTRDGRRLIVSNEDEATASCWDVETGSKVFATPVTEEPEGVAVHPVRDEVYVTCEERGDVFVLDAKSGAKLAQFHVRGRPRSVAFLPDGSRGYVPAEGESEVTVVDATTRRVVQTIKIPGADILPMMAVVSADGRRIFVSTGRGNVVAAIDAVSNTPVGSVTVGQRPWGIALSPDGKTLFAANGRSDDVSVVDVTAMKETGRIKVEHGPWGVAIRTSR